MVVENRVEQVVDMSNYFVYQNFSYGYSWMDNAIYMKILSELKKSDYDVEVVINLPVIWNAIGISVFNMPYVLQGDGTYDFVVPEYSDLIEKDVRTQDKIGKIINKLVKSDKDNAKISKDLTFFLYNDKITTAGADSVIDQNIASIVFNVITVYMLRFIRSKNSID